MSTVGYVAHVIEFERGWGTRPDGYIVCLNKELGKRHATKSNGHVCGDAECFSTAGEFKLCVINESVVSELQAVGAVWTDDVKSYVIEM